MVEAVKSYRSADGSPRFVRDVTTLSGYRNQYGAQTFIVDATLGCDLDAFKEYGTDSYIGLVASISMSCTETIFYTMSVYFMTAKVTKTRYTLGGAMLATFAGLVASTVLAGMMVAG